MIFRNDSILFSPSDLVLFEKSPFASWIERLDKSGLNQIAERDPPDQMMSVLSSMGYEHEDETLDQLKAQGRSVLQIETDAAVIKTRSWTLRLP